MISDKKIVVTGAGGLIGNAVCSLLHAEKIPFLAVYKSMDVKESVWPVEYCDLTDTLSVQNDFWEDTTAMVHCAALIPTETISAENCYIANKQIDQHISEIIQKHHISGLVYLSSSSVYGYPETPVTEETPVSPQSIYSSGKMESEKLFRNLPGCNTVILRINAPYHFSQKTKTVVRIFIENALQNKPLIYHGTGARSQDFTAVHDIASLIVLILQKGILQPCEVFNVSGGDPVSMKDLARMIVSLVPDCTSSIAASGMEDPQENNRSVFKLDKIYRDYTWRPSVTLTSGIKQWIAAIRK